MQALLTRNLVLWGAFIGTIALTFSFQIASEHWQITFVDAISDPEETRAMIAAMSADQRVIHAWVTATLDVAYPLVYGALFAGSGYKFYGKWGWLVAAPVFVLVPTDLIEGVVQVLALVTDIDWVDAKAILTPLKFALVLLGLATTVLGWGIWLVGWLRGA